MADRTRLLDGESFERRNESKAVAMALSEEDVIFDDLHRGS